MPMVMDHIVLNVEDVEKMMPFYTDILAMASERLEAYRGGQVPFPSVRLNADTIIDLFPKKLWQTDSQGIKGFANLNHFCIALDESAWQDLRARLAEHNVAIEDGPAPRWGSHGTGTSIYFRDPEGNLVEARYYEEKTDAKPCLLGT